MKKRLLSLCLIFILIFSLSIFAEGPAKVNFDFSSEVNSGTIRYVSQIPSCECFYQEYWGRFASYATNECGTASVSMALSYIGINKTPLDLGNYWISRGYTWGRPFSTVLDDVPLAEGGETYDFEMAWNRYINGNGAYSPVVIYFSRATNPNRTGNRHFVLVTEKNPDGSYNAVNPSDKDLLNLRIDKNAYGGLTLTVYSKKGTLTGSLTEYEFCSAQYYNPNFVPATKEEVSPVKEEALAEVKPEKEDEALKEASPEKDLISKTPDLVFPKAMTQEDAISLPCKMTELRFSDTGEDTYTLHIRRALKLGRNTSFDVSKTSPCLKTFTFTVGDGYTTRNEDGTISIFLKEGLLEGYIYRFYISSENSLGSLFPTYGIAEY